MKRRGWKRVVVGLALSVVLVMLGLGAYARAAHAAKVGRAKSDMQTIEQAVRKFHAENGEWPPNNNLQVIAPSMECGWTGPIDPWGQPFVLEIERYQDERDGTCKERPVIICRTPTDEVLRYPETSH